MSPAARRRGGALAAAWKAPILSPLGLCVRAALIAIVYGALHLAGGRADVAFLSGTPVGGSGATLLGCAYLLFHFAFVLLAPILVIASLLLGMTNRRRDVSEVVMKSALRLAAFFSTRTRY